MDEQEIRAAALAAAASIVGGVCATGKIKFDFDTIDDPTISLAKKFEEYIRGEKAKAGWVGLSNT